MISHIRNAVFLLMCLGFSLPILAQDPVQPLTNWTEQKKATAESLARVILESHSKKERRRAIGEVGSVGPAARFCIRALIVASKDDSRDVADDATKLLNELEQDPELFAQILFPGVISAFSENEPSGRHATEIYRFTQPFIFGGKPSHLQGLILALADSDTKVVEYAGINLTKIYPELIFPSKRIVFQALVEQLESSLSAGIFIRTFNLRNAFSEIFSLALTDRSFPDRLALDEFKQLVQILKRHKYGTVLTEKEGRLILDLLANPDSVIRNAAAAVLQSAASAAVPHLFERITMNRTDSVAFVLQRIGVDGVPFLIEKLGDVNSDVRAKSAWSLGLLGKDAAQAAEALSELASGDIDRNVQAAAANALASIGSVSGPIEIEKTTIISSYLLGPEKEARWIKISMNKRWRSSVSYGPLPSNIRTPDLVASVYDSHKNEISRIEGALAIFDELEEGTYFLKVFLKSGQESDQTLTVKIDLIEM